MDCETPVPAQFSATVSGASGAYFAIQFLAKAKISI